jgi:hypothetical protein
MMLFQALTRVGIQGKPRRLVVYCLDYSMVIISQSSVELLFLVQRFVVPVQPNLTDRGLHVPTLTPVDK